MSKNKLLAMVNEKLRASGQKALAAPTPTPPAPPAREVRYFPGGLDVYALNLDQPEPPPMGEAEANRRARLAAAAFETAQSLSERERIERAKARRDAILKR